MSPKRRACGPGCKGRSGPEPRSRLTRDKSPVRESRTPGSVGEVPGNRHLYPTTSKLCLCSYLTGMQIGTAVTLPRDIDADLDRWLAPFLDVTGRSTRRRMAPLYVRGLLGPDGPKSIQPMAERLGLSGHDQLHHFITSPAWDDTPLWGVLAEQADQLVGGPDAVLVVDDSGMPKKGTASVGVAPQYCGALGKM